MSPEEDQARQVRAARVLRLLQERGWTVGVAESLTGGDLCSAFVGVAGASLVLRGGVVAYATELKARLLGVDLALLDRVGAVDPEVARQMAAGAVRVLGADWGVATTGAAGPASQDGAPPGLVHVAVVGPDGRRAARDLHLTGSREQVRSGAVDAALDLLDDALTGGGKR